MVIIQQLAYCIFIGIVGFLIFTISINEKIDEYKRLTLVFVILFWLATYFSVFIANI
jgi:uncharacterized membrane protein